MKHYFVVSPTTRPLFLHDPWNEPIFLWEFILKDLNLSLITITIIFIVAPFQLLIVACFDILATAAFIKVELSQRRWSLFSFCDFCWLAILVRLLDLISHAFWRQQEEADEKTPLLDWSEAQVISPLGKPTSSPCCADSLLKSVIPLRCYKSVCLLIDCYLSISKYIFITPDPDQEIVFWSEARYKKLTSLLQTYWVGYPKKHLFWILLRRSNHWCEWVSRGLNKFTAV